MIVSETTVTLLSHNTAIVIKDELKRQPISEPHLVKRTVVKIQRNDEPVAECSRDRGIRLGCRYSVTRAKPNFCSVSDWMP